MKKFRLAAAAGLLLATMSVSTAAQADRGDRWQNGQHNDRRFNDHRGDRRDYYRHSNYRHDRHCRTEWRHHHRVRVCR